jgi:hypothetical protein
MSFKDILAASAKKPPEPEVLRVRHLYADNRLAAVATKTDLNRIDIEFSSGERAWIVATLRGLERGAVRNGEPLGLRMPEILERRLLFALNDAPVGTRVRSRMTRNPINNYHQLGPWEPIREDH